MRCGRERLLRWRTTSSWDLLAEHGDSPDDPIPVAIETSHGLLVASLRTGSRRGFAINPLAAARYRDRHGVETFAICGAVRKDAAAAG